MSFFMVFLRPSKQALGKLLGVDADNFLQNLFLFIIDQSSLQSILFNLDTEIIVK
jgi:hypothetical protein